LPCDDDQNRPITLDLNGHVAVRAKPAGSTQPTEVLLTNSSFSGESVRVSMNRDYLARAVRLGFRELCLKDDKSAILSVDADRQYVWMPLTPEAAIPPSKTAIRIVSPNSESEPSPPTNRIERKTPVMPEPVTQPNGNGQSNGHAKSNGRAKVNGEARRTKAHPQDIAALIERAQKLRGSLHELTHEASGLVKALKQHRRQGRVIQSTLASLRQLKGLGA
jgi:hypothetical protein